MIVLYGSLARKLKKHYPGIDPKNIPCKVKSAGEVIRALDSQFKGFKSWIRRKGYYRVVRGTDVMDDSKVVNTEKVSLKFSETTWHLMPVALGMGKGGGPLMVVLGAILVIAAVVLYVYAPAGAPAWYSMMYQGLAMMGVSMMLTGISMMLTPVPDMPESGKDGDTPSYIFNGSLNVDDPGTTVPICYGESWIGSVVTSFGVRVIKYSDEF